MFRETANQSTIYEKVTDGFGETAKTFFIMVTLTCILLILVGSALMLQSKLINESVISMKGLEPSMSSHFFADMIRMEIPGFSADNESEYTFSHHNVLTFLTQLLTNINPKDPISFISFQVPGIREDTVPLRRGLTGMTTSPVDYAPPFGAFEPDLGEHVDEPVTNDPPIQPDKSVPGEATTEPEPEPGAKTVFSTDGKKVVFV